MAKLKIKIKWTIILIVVFLSVGFLSDYIMDSGFKTNKGIVADDTLRITDVEAKSSSVNGYVKGEIRNTVGAHLSKINITVAFYDKNGDKIGEKVGVVENLAAFEVKNFTVNHYYKHVKSYRIVKIDYEF